MCTQIDGTAQWSPRDPEQWHQHHHWSYKVEPGRPWIYLLVNWWNQLIWIQNGSVTVLLEYFEYRCMFYKGNVCSSHQILSICTLVCLICTLHRLLQVDVVISNISNMDITFVLLEGRVLWDDEKKIQQCKSSDYTLR